MKPTIIVAVFILLVAGCKSAVGPDTTPPYPPQGLGSISLDNSIQIDWLPSQAPDVKGYNVWRNLSPGGNFLIIGSTSGTSFVDGSAVNGTTYFYRVSAYDLA
ncbi:MAG TPA: hypothetical protein VMM37_01510, partial [Bacteroidota bacterium]|nr:hypothetical protein [Bacteroidota bacterium]